MESSAESGTRARTRRAILDAAVASFHRDPLATLADVAQSAGVGRTTVHRYFPERADLLKAVAADAADRITQGFLAADLESGTGAEALLRLIDLQLEHGDLLGLISRQPQFSEYSPWAEEDELDDSTKAVVERGQADGSIDPQVPASWVHEVLWAMIYIGWNYRSGEPGGSLAARDLVRATFLRSISPQ